MKKKIALSGLVLVILILLVWWFYNNDLKIYHYIFRGESPSWSAQLDSVGNIIKSEKNGKLTYDCNERRTLTVTYKYDLSELANVKHLEIAYETKFGGGSHIMDFDQDGSPQKTFKLKSGGNGWPIEKDDTVVVTISIDGQSEMIDLINQD